MTKSGNWDPDIHDIYDRMGEYPSSLGEIMQDLMS